MLKIIYSDLALYKIELFLNYLKINDRYNDTWLYNESVIKENYIQRWYELIEELVDTIDYILLNWNLGRIIEEKTVKYEKSRIFIWIRSYKIFVSCKLDIKNNIYYIEDIMIRS